MNAKATPILPAVLAALILLSGCETMYYDMVMDKPEKGQPKDDIMDRASDVSRLSSYR